ncbi:MAG: hypothetical protein WHF31_12520 [Candidatus Dehalobacter alkaniphilus]
MSKLVELYVNELLKDGSSMTIDDVPAGLRPAVQAAVDTASGAGGD